MTRPEKWNWLHRDSEGNAVLVGPNCPDCLRREIVVYCCTACPQQWAISGTYRWSWQGKSHYHDADDESRNSTFVDHVDSHCPAPAMIVPREMLGRWT